MTQTVELGARRGRRASLTPYDAPYGARHPERAVRRRHVDELIVGRLLAGEELPTERLLLEVPRTLELPTVPTFDELLAGGPGPVEILLGWLR